MKGNLKAIDGEETTEDALLETGSKHNHIVFFIHIFRSIRSGTETGERKGKIEDSISRVFRFRANESDSMIWMIICIFFFFFLMARKRERIRLTSLIVIKSGKEKALLRGGSNEKWFHVYLVL